MRLDHAIFQKPLAAGVTLDKTNAWEPEADPRGMWTVQDGIIGKENDYGVVSDGHGFQDSPDCERISSGQNSKGPHAVAIGRQANMLQWGFYCAPDRMTDSARKAFLNAIVYMKRFDGHRPLVKKASRSRSWLAQHVETVRGLDTKYKKYGASYRGYLKRQFPAGLIDRLGFDADALEAWRKKNVEYLFRSKSGYQVDADLAKLGISNRKPEFLDWLVGTLKKNDDDPVARRLAKRYLGDRDADAVAFIAKNRKWLFFSDTGGYRWIVDENAKARAKAAG